MTTPTIDTETPAELLELREKIKATLANRDKLAEQRDGHAAARDKAVTAADPQAVSRHAAKTAQADDELAGYEAVLAHLREQARPLEETETARLTQERNERLLGEAREKAAADRAELDKWLKALEECAEAALNGAALCVSLVEKWQASQSQVGRLEAILAGQVRTVGQMEDPLEALAQKSIPVRIMVQNRDQRSSFQHR